MIQEYHPRWSSFIRDSNRSPHQSTAKIGGNTMYIDAPLKCNIGPWKDALPRQQVAFQSLSFWGCYVFKSLYTYFLCVLQSIALNIYYYCQPIPLNGLDVRTSHLRSWKNTLRCLNYPMMSFRTFKGGVGYVSCSLKRIDILKDSMFVWRKWRWRFFFNLFNLNTIFCVPKDSSTVHTDWCCAQKEFSA